MLKPMEYYTFCTTIASGLDTPADIKGMLINLLIIDSNRQSGDAGSHGYHPKRIRCIINDLIRKNRESGWQVVPTLPPAERGC